MSRGSLVTAALLPLLPSGIKYDSLPGAQIRGSLKFLTGIAKLRKSVFSFYRQQGFSLGNQLGHCLIL